MPQTFFDEVNQAAQKVAKYFEASAAYKETPVAIRVVGEFSSGKTRFIKELFGSAIPEALEPVSSREVQTFIPLELTYGPKPTLTLIKSRESINDPEIIGELDSFPERGTLAGYSETGLRLRLSLPEERLILKSGDGRSESVEPRLLRIVDYPGWNSEDEDRGLESLGLSSEWLNLAMIYICSATRAETRTNMENLKIFLEALLDGDLEIAAAKMPLYLIITSAETGESRAMVDRLEKFVREILGNSADDFPILILPVDFAAIRANELADLRSAFWNHLAKAGCELGKPGSAKRKQDLQAASELINYLSDCCKWIKKLRAIHGGLKPNGQFMGGRSMRFFDGLKQGEIGEKVLAAWKKLALPDYSPGEIAEMRPPVLPADHFLKPWLDVYWMPRLMEPQKNLCRFLDRIRQALLEINPEIQNLEKYLESQVGWAYQQAGIPLSFELLMAQVAKFSRSMEFTTIVTTLISLSLMEASFRNRKGAMD